jgi:hypothetical protein
MKITIDIRPEAQAELERLAADQGRAIERVAADLLEEAVRFPAAAPEHRSGPEIIDAFQEIRGLLTDHEIDQMFRRNPSTARPVDLS